MGAALAYYGVFALGPILIIAIALAGWLFGEEAAHGRLAETLDDVLGPTVAGAVTTTLKHVHVNRSAWSASLVGFGILLFAATGLFSQLQLSLNEIWGCDDASARPFRTLLRSRCLAFVMVMSVGALLVASLAVNLVVGTIHDNLPRLSASGWLAFLDPGHELTSWVLVTLLFALVYRWLPPAAVAWRHALLGAALSALLFTAGNYLIGKYLAWSAPSLAFGPASYLIVVMLWVYYSSQVVLAGAVFTEVLARPVAPRADGVPGGSVAGPSVGR